MKRGWTSVRDIDGGHEEYRICLTTGRGAGRHSGKDGGGGNGRAGVF